MKLDKRINDKSYAILILNIDDKSYFYEDIIPTPLHNLNGPAIIDTNGLLEYWIDDKCVGDNLSNKEFQQKVKAYIFK